MKKQLKPTVIFFLLIIMSISAFSQYSNAFRFRINGNGYSDETIIRLVNDASEEFDGNYDAWKLFSSNPNVPSIYTQIEEGQELSINALPEFDEDVSITLYTNIPESGVYTLDVEEVFALTTNYKISLSDVSSNTHFQLFGDTALVFTVDAHQNTPTFTFNISAAAILSTADESCLSQKNGVLNIENSGNNDWNLTLKDENSNIILSEDISSPTYNNNSMSAGNYVATISSKGIVENYNFTISPGVQVSAEFELSEDTLYLDEGAELFVTNNSENATNYLWDFGDNYTTTETNPIYNYYQPGTYAVRLASFNENCFSEKQHQVVVYLTRGFTGGGLTTGVKDEEVKFASIANYGNGMYSVKSVNSETKNIQVYNLNGALVFEDSFSANNYTFSLAGLSQGIYVANVIAKNGTQIQHKIKR